MSDVQKCPNLVRGGGGQHFSKSSNYIMDLRFLLFGPILFILGPYWYWGLICLNKPPVSIIIGGFQNK